MFLAIPIFLEFVNDFYPYFVFFLLRFCRPILSLVYNKKTPGLFTGSSKNYECIIRSCLNFKIIFSYSNINLNSFFTKCMFLQRADP